MRKRCSSDLIILGVRQEKLVNDPLKQGALDVMHMNILDDQGSTGCPRALSRTPLPSGLYANQTGVGAEGTWASKYQYEDIAQCLISQGPS